MASGRKRVSLRIRLGQGPELRDSSTSLQRGWARRLPVLLRLACFCAYAKTAAVSLGCLCCRGGGCVRESNEGNARQSAAALAGGRRGGRVDSGRRPPSAVPLADARDLRVCSRQQRAARELKPQKSKVESQKSNARRVDAAWLPRAESWRHWCFGCLRRSRSSVCSTTENKSPRCTLAAAQGRSLVRVIQSASKDPENSSREDGRCCVCLIFNEETPWSK